MTSPIPVLTLICILFSMLPRTLFADPDRFIRLVPDFEAAREIVRLYEQGSVETAEMDALLNLDGVQAMLSQIQRFNASATEDRFRRELALSVSGEDLPGPDDFQFNRIRKNLSGITSTMAWIEDHPEELESRILQLIAPYSPLVNTLEVRYFIVLGGNSDGWTRNNTFYTALQYFGDDTDGLVILVAHELYHVVQKEFVGQPVHEGDTPQARVEQLLEKTIWEGTASYICDPLAVEGGGAYTEWYSKKYQRNLNHLELNFDLMETLVFRAYNDPDASLRDLYNIGFSGALESPLYFVGLEMAREIESVSGRQALLDLMRQPSADFFLHYAAITGGEGSDAIPFSDGFREILGAVQAAPAR